MITNIFVRKRSWKLVGVSTLLMGVMFTGCSKSLEQGLEKEKREGEGKGKEKILPEEVDVKYIHFKVSNLEALRGSCINETKDLGGFKVYASDRINKKIMNGTFVKYSEEDGRCSYSPLVEWPATGSVNFYAADVNVDKVDFIAGSTDKATAEFTIQDDVKNQKDVST